MSPRVPVADDDMGMDVAAATVSVSMEALEMEAEGGVKRRLNYVSSLSTAQSTSLRGCNSANVVGVPSQINGESISIRGPEPPSKKCRRMGNCPSSADAAGSIGNAGRAINTLLPVSADQVPKANFVALRRVSEVTDDLASIDVGMAEQEEEAPESISSDSETSRQDIMSPIARASPIPLPLNDSEQYTLGGSRSTSKRAIITPSSSFLVGAKGSSIADALQANPLLRREQSMDVNLSVSEPSKYSGKKNSFERLDSVDGNLVSKKNSRNVSTREKVQPSPETTKPERGPTCITKFLVFLASLIFLEASLLVADKFFDLPFDPSFSLNQPVHPDSVYVPGAGFSGFWFTLGRLKSIPHPADKVYYCYSAGCLGVVATLGNRTMREMTDLALGVQRMWKDGTIDRYDVTTRFVESLLHLEGGERMHYVEGGDNATVGSSGIVDSRPMDNANLLSKINILTTAKDATGVRHMIRSPKDIFELKEMLVQTTWIPFATGGGLWSTDSRTGEHHMDGGFSAITHPKCAHHLGLPLMLDLFMNILNVNLGLDKVEKYWNAGVELGV